MLRRRVLQLKTVVVCRCSCLSLEIAELAPKLRLVQPHALSVALLAVLLDNMLVATHESRWPGASTRSLHTGLVSPRLAQVQTRRTDRRRILGLVFQLSFDFLEVALELFLGCLEILLLLLYISFFPMHDFLQTAHRMEEFLAQIDK